MVHISKDIKDLLDKEPKTIKTSKMIYRVVIFLAFLGLLSIIVGATMTCSHKTAPDQTVIEEPAR